ncbi:MAG: UDP-N-acetylmuramoyl-tripeptide--D-alanyl-D-alanine ligase [Acidimicrobiia bacterium]|nr:UDP-N-acetylmuramoyl-tripeptide--D-alanyl-D-alanine ligase [Acidimicrobiia bacterium]NNL68960.1 UDP-N-acetylmuramoyl-tripeptide--D-alanyl-D-alanine ligase [Acidimicrobiia bacterium]
MRWTAADVAGITGGSAVGSAEITGVSTDTRTLKPGDLFVALRGENFDGAAFAGEALAGGAAAVMVDHPVPLEPRIEVPDTLVALRRLAEARRGELADLRTVGITGSTGKTSCKDLLASALGRGTWASPRSFNNEIGVPLTLLSTPPDSEVAVLEVGSRGVGHIRTLIDVVRPDVAIITGIGASHLATLGTVEMVRTAKWELVQGLGPAGVAVLPVDDPVLLEWADRDGVQVTTFGADGDVSVGEVVLDDLARPSFRLSAYGESVEVQLEMAGAHQAVNAAAATAAGLALGRALPDLASGLAEATGSSWRMEVTAGSYTVVNDAYNANPTSMTAALRTVAGMPGRHLAVLGMMAELGEASSQAHRSIGRLARELGFETVVVVGDDPGIAEGAGDIAVSAPDVESATRAISERVGNGDVVLVKASRSVGLEVVAGELVP